MTIQAVPVSSKFYIVDYKNAYPMLIGIETMRDLSCKIDFNTNTLTIKNKYFITKNSKPVTIPPKRKGKVYIQPNIPFDFNNTAFICKTRPEFRPLLSKYVRAETDTFGMYLTAYNPTRRSIHIASSTVVGNMKITPHDDLFTNMHSLHPVHVVDYLEEYNKHRNPHQGPLSFRPIPSLDTPPLAERTKRHLYPTPCVTNTHTPVPVPDTTLIAQQLCLRDTRLTATAQASLRRIVNKHSAAFSLRGEVGHCTQSEIDFTLKDDKDFYIRPFYSSRDDRQHLEKQIQELLKMNIIEHSETRYISPAFLVKKFTPDGKPKHRMVIDYRHLNTLIQRPNFSPNLFKQAIELIGQEQSKYITLVDIKSAFYALNLSKRSQKYTGFTPYHGSASYVFKRLPMGLNISPAKFTNFIVSILRNIPNSDDFALPIMDDLLIVSHTESDHLEHIDQVLSVMAKYGLKLSLDKCHFAKKSLTYMGYNISFDNSDCPIVQIEQSKVDAITKLKPPRTIRQLRSFLGMILFLSPHLKELQIIAKPLYDLTRKRDTKSTKLPWTDVHDKAFNDLKRLITRAPVLYAPTRDGHFVLKVDTSKHGTGAELSQYQSGNLHLIAYYSKSLPPACKGYSPTELELAGILICMEAFRHILSGKHFHLLTDHSALCHIVKSKTIPPNRRIARFLEKLSFFDFSLSYLRGQQMFIPDFLSRNPYDSPNDPIKQVAFYDLTKQQAQQLLEQPVDSLAIMTRSQYRRVNPDPGTTINQIPRNIQQLNTPSPSRHKPGRQSKQYTTVTSPIITHPPQTRRPTPPATRRPRPPIKPAHQIRHTPDTPTLATQAPTLSGSEAPFPRIAATPLTSTLPADIFTKQSTGPSITDFPAVPYTTKSIIKRNTDLIPKNNDFTVEETHDPPDQSTIGYNSLQPLFDNTPSKSISYKITNQKALDPLIRIIKERTIHNYDLNFSKVDLIQKQRTDPYFKNIYQYLLDGSLPKNRKEVQLVRKYADDYFLYDDVLFKLSYNNTTAILQYRLCIPQPFITYILELYHNSLLGGHTAFSRTYLTIRQRYFFPRMYQEVHSYIRTNS
jgi:hypothetical protein